MQKKIIALAVAGLMSGAAFAQSNVTISGNFDAGLRSVKTEGNANGAIESAGYGISSTNQIFIKAQEDLGNGMKAGVLFETNPVDGTIGTSQRYIWMSGAFGEFSAGQRNNFSLVAATTSEPFGTAVGGGYGGGLLRLRGAGAVGAPTYSVNGTRDVRTDGSLRYDTPKFGGFSAGISFEPKNNNVDGGNTQFGLNYAGGPLKVAYAYSQFKNDVALNAGAAAGNGTYTCNGNVTAAIAGVLISAPSLAAANAACVGLGGAGDTATQVTAPVVAGAGAAAAFTQNVKHNILGANYSFGAATVYAGYTTSKGNVASAVSDVNSQSWNLGVKYVMGNIALMGNYLKDNDKTAVDADRKLLGLGLDYSLSKRTTAYLRYENVEPNDQVANDKVRTYAVGLRHSF